MSELLQSGATVAGPASRQMIEDGETTLAVRFPPSYRHFLAAFGAALCPGFEIAGLFRTSTPDEPPLFTDVVATTLQVRRALRGEIPHEYVAISDDGGDYTFYLVSSTCSEEREAPVVVLGPGADGVVVADDLPDFVVRSYERTLTF
jgi:hypothetical protein